MYEVKVTGNNLEELRTNFRNINSVFNNESIVITEVEKETTAVESVPLKAVEEIVKGNGNIGTGAFTETPVEYKPVTLAPTTPVVPGPVGEVVPGPVGEVDSENVPWDARIHTDKRTKNKSGDWKLKRGVDKDYATQVKEEIRVHSAPVTQAPIAPVVPTNTVPQTPVAPVAPIVQAPAIVETVAPVLPTNGGHTLESFSTNFAMILANLITEKKINQKYIEDLKAYFNTTEIWDINEAQKAELFESFSGFGFITKM